jgi:LMBR1 domain-containing protein 1
LYFFAYISHSEEQDFAKSWITRIYTILIILFGLLQQFFVSLDLANKYSDGGLPLVTLFSIYYCVLAVLLFIVLPFSTFYYETSEETSVYFRIRGAFFRCALYAFLMITLIVVTFFITKDEKTSLFIYVIAFFMIFGWFLLFFTLGVGLVAVPFDLILSFINRPKPISQAEFEVNKKVLLDNLLFLRKRCNESLEDRTKIDSQKGFKGWWANARLTRRVASLHAKTLVLEHEYIRLVKLSKFNKYVEPIAYYLKLILAIMFILIDCVFIVQIFGCQFLNYQDIEGCKFDFLNTIVRNLSRQDVGLGFITTGIILALSIYLLF